MRHVISQVRQHAKSLMGGALGIVFPPRCLGCKVVVEEAHRLCGECWKQLAFISAPYCQCCGHPFSLAVSSDMLCAQCLRETPVFSKARSVLHYDAASKNLILGMKFYDRTELVPLFAEWLKQWISLLPAEIDYIVPVPLHRWRLWKRRFNQAALLSYALSHKTGIRVMVDALIRTRYTTPQADLTRLQRLENVKGVFAPNPKRHTQISGANIVLIDDVMTTMATINACTRALKKAGAENVYVLTLARTVIGD